MRYLQFRERFKSWPLFSLRMARLIDPSLSSQQLSRWQHQGYIERIIRGWYRFTDTPVTEDLLLLVANKIIKPSYVSLEYVLSRANLIPEGVFQITSVTSKKTQQFDTNLAAFDYRHIKPLLMFGYSLYATAWGNVCIAYTEKALLDYLYLHPQIKDDSNFAAMRLDKEGINQLSLKRLRLYLKVFANQALTNRLERLLTYAAN